MKCCGYVLLVGTVPGQVAERWMNGVIINWHKNQKATDTLIIFLSFQRTKFLHVKRTIQNCNVMRDSLTLIWFTSVFFSLLFNERDDWLQIQMDYQNFFITSCLFFLLQNTLWKGLLHNWAVIFFIVQNWQRYFEQYLPSCFSSCAVVWHFKTSQYQNNNKKELCVQERINLCV